MPPAGRRISAAAAIAAGAAAAGLFGLTAFALMPELVPAPVPVPGLPRCAPAAVPQQTIDLSEVPSAPEYRTDEPDGPGFLGSDAEVLDRVLARINQDLGTSLRPDNRLARLTRWVYQHIGPDRSLPSQSATDALAGRLGLAEPLPHLLVIDARNEPRLADIVSSRLAKVFDLAEYTHIGGVAERETSGAVVVVALSRRHIEMAPVPRSLAKPGRIALDGRLVGAYAGSELAHTSPGGETRIEALGQGTDFRATVALAGTGRHRLEIIAQGPNGPDVVANFPIFVGVPVDDSVEAAPAPGAVLRPDEARKRLFELINAERAKAGLAALTFDPELAAVALRHSEDMRANDFVSHVSPTAGSTEDRLLRAGIVTGLAAENVGKGYAPDEIHRGFMDSPGHRAAILLAGATHVGIGIVVKKEYGRTSYLVTELVIRRIPPLGPGAKIVFRKELNRLRALVGAPAVKEDLTLTLIANKAAREVLAEPSLSRDKALARLRDSLGRVGRKARSFYSLFSVVGSLDEGARQAAADPKTGRAGSVGIGIAQGEGPGLAPNSIVVVLIFVE